MAEITIEKQKIPFNIVDFFAYLGTGFAAMIIFMALREAYIPDGEFSKTTQSKIIANPIIAVPTVITFSYLLGHVISQVSYLIIDRFVVAKLLGHARNYSLSSLTGTSSQFAKPNLFRKAALWILGASSYKTSLSEEVMNPLSARYIAQMGVPLVGSRQAERQCFTVVNESRPRTADRLHLFLAIYTLCRNTSFLLLCLGVFAVILAGPAEFWLESALLSAGWLLLGRHLIFLKFYTDEIYLAYCTGDHSGASKESAKEPADGSS